MTSGNAMLDGILWGGAHWPSSGSTTTITYYFAHAAEFVPEERDWTSIEQDAYRTGLQSWASVANVQFTEVFTPGSATFIAHSVSGAFFNDGTLGSHDVPDNPAPADGYFNYEGTGWDGTDPNGGLQTGGFGANTVLHELGHGLGLAHPHDHGGGSTVWPGVGAPFDSYGDNSLNQGIFTVMSYNQGWDGFQDPWSHGLRIYGFVGGPMAFDIAAVQYLYGANTSYHSGDNTYTLPDSNGPGTYWTCIWDTGGVDQIIYGGSLNVIIDLRAATIDNSSTGGGIPTYANGIYGGFTIANGVIVENASSGNGNDSLTGNSADNLISAGGGIDSMLGGGGRDTVEGGDGNDTIDGGDGQDVARFSGSSTEYDVIDNGDGSLTVSHTRGIGDHGSDLIRNVELLQFDLAAADDTATTNEDITVSINVLANDTAGSPAITATTNGAHGTVALNDNGTVGNFADDFVTYTPNADFNGTDTFTYTVTSGGATETASVTVTVNAVADIVGDLATTNEDTAVNVLVLANDTFEGTEAITATTNGAHGTVTVNDNATPGDTTDDFVVYTQTNADFNGTDSFTYTVTSGGVTETATVSITVNAVADIVGDSVTVAQNSGASNLDLLANDTFENPGRSITAVGAAAHGTTSINNNGTVGNTTDDFVAYTPTAGYSGPDSFTYTVTAGGVTETGTVSVAVTAPPAPQPSTTPTSGNDDITGTEGPDTIVALAGDDIVDGQGAGDLLLGNQGNDTVSGRTGNDTIWGGQGNDSLDGAEDNDFLWGNEGADTIVGGDGANTIVGGQDSSDAADSITAGSGPDLIWGNGGADTIVADGGNNTLIGGFGADSLLSGAGDDIVFGNENNDTIAAGDGAALIFGGLGDDWILTGSGNDTIFGNENNDTMAGGTGADRYAFLVGSGNDQINGFSGSAEGDRLDLQGQTFTTSASADGDLLLLLSGGGTIELNGIAPANFSPGFVL